MIMNEKTKFAMVTVLLLASILGNALQGLRIYQDIESMGNKDGFISSALEERDQCLDKLEQCEAGK